MTRQPVTTTATLPRRPTQVLGMRLLGMRRVSSLSIASIRLGVGLTGTWKTWPPGQKSNQRLHNSSVIPQTHGREGYNQGEQQRYWWQGYVWARHSV